MGNALSGDLGFIERMNISSLTGFVHSTFRKTINIHCFENGELYTIASTQIDNGPNTLVINLASFEGLNIHVNDQVFVKNNTLFISNKLAISIGEIERWESILPEYPSDLQKVNRNLIMMKEYIDFHGKAGGMKKKLFAQSPYETEMSRLLEERTNLLINELSNNRLANAVCHAVSLVGLGPGLTPSGDDFLVGLFTIMNLRKSPFYLQQSFRDEVVMRANSLTNEISYMTLKKASIGKVRESIIHLVHSILNGKEDELYLPLNKVLNIGSSSGTDIATGLICGLEANLRVGGQL
ncbi:MULTISPECIES: DUF2877 domain-containing protein [unclassified Bacillus (in: firmicutes)]|uniref:DUF2877 domain-containing protein n=1 Tax=unclassified Bacillus (in: firmicutes) TaxID=185979 RepID=UPI002034E1A6|nr:MULTISPECIES: DUF2877 domain-containing protein [unclassified Bacillus (in: firmicutes)]